MGTKTEPDMCPRCDHPLGTNSECEACVEWLVRAGASAVDEKAASSVIEDMAAWLGSHSGVGPANFFKQVVLLYEMLRDSVRGDYEAPWASLAMIVGALVYVISPLDLIPDFIPVIGWGDDAAVVVATIKTIQGDLRDYAQWRGIDLGEYGLA